MVNRYGEVKVKGFEAGCKRVVAKREFAEQAVVAVIVRQGYRG